MIHFQHIFNSTYLLESDQYANVGTSILWKEPYNDLQTMWDKINKKKWSVLTNKIAEQVNWNVLRYDIKHVAYTYIILNKIFIVYAVLNNLWI